MRRGNMKFIVLLFLAVFPWIRGLPSEGYPRISIAPNEIKKSIKELNWRVKADSWMDDKTEKLGLGEDCVKDVDAMLLGFKKTEPWAAYMIDAQGVMEPGYLQGNTRSPGMYDECVRVRMSTNITGQERSIKGKHCMTHFKTRLTHGGVGVCFPSSCNASEVKILVCNYNLTREEIPKNATVWCTEDKDITKDVPAIVTLCIIGVFVILLIVGTVMDVRYEKMSDTQENDKGDINSSRSVDNKNYGTNKNMKEHNLEMKDHNSHSDTDIDNVKDDGENHFHIAKRLKSILGFKVKQGSEPLLMDQTEEETPGAFKRILLSFSLYTNGRNLLSTKQPAGTFTCLHGIRFLSMAWIISGHSYALFFTRGIDTVVTANLLAYKRYMEPMWISTVFNQMPDAVDSFFVMSAFLVSVSFLRTLKRSEGKVAPKTIGIFYLHRYWRLTPAYAAVMMIYTFLIPYVSGGPLRKPDMFQECREHWWTNLLYINNFVGFHCMGWGWYLACDFQFYIISPLILTLLYRCKKIGITLVGIIFAMTITLNLYTMFGVHTSSLDYFIYNYGKPYTRIGPYLQGLVLGYVFSMTEFKFKLSKVLIIAGWIGAVTLTSLVVFLPHFYCDGCWSIASEIIFDSLHSNLFSLSVSWIIFACISGHGSCINSFLSWNFFIPLSKLTYVVYIFHPVMMNCIIYSGRNVHYLSWWNLMYSSGANILFSTIFSSVISLTFEVPMLGVEKVILPARK